MEYYKQYKKELDKIFLSATVLIFIYVFIKYIGTYVAPFIIALIISKMIEPIISLLETKFKTKRLVSICISILFVFVVIALGVKNILYIGTRQGQLLLYQMQELEIHKMIDNFMGSFGTVLIVPFVGNLVAALVSFFMQTATEFIMLISRTILFYVPMLIVNVIVVIIATVFFIKDKEVIHTNIKKIMPYIYSKSIIKVKTELSTTLLKYIKAQFILMAIVFVIVLIGTLIIQPNYAMIISIGVAVADILPIFGSGAILLPWAFFEFLYGNTQKSILIAMLWGSISLIRQLIEPKIIGKQIGLHPILTLMSIYIGARIFGIFGFFIGPATAIIIKAINMEED
jgi:sporulation integral membrane protein YtvI